MSTNLRLLTFIISFFARKISQKISSVEFLTGIFLGIALTLLFGISPAVAAKASETEGTVEAVAATPIPPPPLTQTAQEVVPVYTSPPEVPPEVISPMTPIEQPLLATSTVSPTAEGEISQAALSEGCPASLLIALWRSETGPSYTFSAHNGWFSFFVHPQSGARGPFQFMPDTWPTYAKSGESTFRVLDSAAAACRMLKRLNLLDQPNRTAFIRRFTGADNGLVWNRHPGQAADIWDEWHR